MIEVQADGREAAGSEQSIALVASDEATPWLEALLHSMGRTVIRIVALRHTAAGEGHEAAVVLLDPAVAEQRAELRALRTEFSGIPMVAIVPDGTSQQNLRETVAAGADGVVLDSDADRALETSLQAVALGQVVVPRALVSHFQKPVLSAREKQVLGMVVMGLSNAEIASRLFLAESTVKSHLSSAFSRLGVKSRKQATAMILDPDSGLGPGILAISGDLEKPAA